LGASRPPSPPNAQREQRGVEITTTSNSLLWLGRSHAPDGSVEVTDWRMIEDSAGNGARFRIWALYDFPDPSRGSDLGNDEHPTVITVPAPGSVVVNVRRADGTPAPPNTV